MEGIASSHGANANIEEDPTCPKNQRIKLLTEDELTLRS